MASLDDPFLLSTYSNEASTRKEGNDDFSFRVATSAVVYLDNELGEGLDVKNKQARSGGNRKTIAVNTVQANGVHLIDLSDQSPLSSFTVSPTTHFTSQATSVSYTTANNAGIDNQQQKPSTSVSASQSSQIRKTFVGVATGDASFELWCWTEQEKRDGTSIGAAVKVIQHFQEPVVSIDASTLDKHLLVALKDGLIVLLNFDLEKKTTLPLNPLHASSKHKRSYEITFQAPLLGSNLGLLGFQHSSKYILLPAVAFHSDAKKIRSKQKESHKKSKGSKISPDGNLYMGNGRVRRIVEVYVLAIDTAGSTVHELAAFDVPGEDVIDIAVLRGLGSILSLHADGYMKTYVMSPAIPIANSVDDFLDTSLSESLKLTSAKVETIKLSSKMTTFTSSRLLPLIPSPAFADHNSHILLASPIPNAEDTIALLLWDAKFSLFTAQQELSIPSLPQDDSPSSGQLQLGLSKLDEHHLGISFSPVHFEDDVNPRRSLIYAMPCDIPATSTLANVIGKQSLTQKYVSLNRAEAKPGLSFTGLPVINADTTRQDAQQKLLKRLAELLSLHAESRQIMLAEDVYKAYNEEQHITYEQGISKKEQKAFHRQATLPTPLADQILRLALPPGNSELPIAGKIIADLLKKRAVSDGSLSGGLTSALLEAKDWANVLLALKHLPDIPETCLVMVLKARLESRAGKGKEKAESRSYLPSLPLVLSRVIRCPVTPQTFRSAIRAQLTIEELAPVLDILDAWLSEDEKASNSKSGSFPGLQYIISILQIIFDAHLVSILQQPSLHVVVQSLSQHLAIQKSLLASLQTLRGPLEALSRLHQQQVTAVKAKTGQKGKYKQPKDDEEVRRQAKMRQQQEALAVEQYSVEKFKL